MAARVKTAMAIELMREAMGVENAPIISVAASVDSCRML